jgi:hypothetical protein
VADGRLTRTRLRDVRAWPAPVRVAAIYLVARLVTTGIMLLVAEASPPGSRYGPDPSLVDYILGWDAQWYWSVAGNGYPTDLPLTAAGEVAENEWAFLPLYAWLAALIGRVLGAWWAGAVVVSLAAGYAACLALHALLRARLDEDRATWGVVLLAAGPLAALFQVGYAESLFLALLIAALLCVERRRWAWLYLLIPVMGFTRPGVLALALFIGLYGLWRLTPPARRTMGGPTRAEVVHILALGALATVVGFAWPRIADLVTGTPNAYLETELAWRRGWTGDDGAFAPFSGWPQAAAVWADLWGIPAGAGYALLAVLVVGAAAAILLGARRAGAVLSLWGAAYVVYLLAVFFPQSSIFRLLLPLAPLACALLARPRARAFRMVLLALCLLGQWAWIHGMYGLGNTFWLIP